MTPDPSVKRVLIYRIGSLGDTVAILPCLHLLERVFPNSERRMLTNFPIAGNAAAAQAVLGDSGLVHGYYRYAMGARNPVTLAKLALKIRTWKPDVCVYLTYSRGLAVAERDRKFFKACGVGRLVGLPDTQDLQDSRIVGPNQFIEHEAIRLARTIEELGDANPDDRANWDLRLNEAEEAAGEKALAPAGGRPIIAVSLGTKQPANDWGVENWKKLLALLAEQYSDHTVVLLGAESEAEKSLSAAEAWVGDATPARLLNLCGKVSPRESAAVMKRSKVFLGHDSGPVHLAAAAGTRCVAVFSSRNRPGMWFPYGEGHRVLYHPVDCMGCRLEVCIEQKQKCILSITPEEVMEKVKEVLG